MRPIGLASYGPDLVHRVLGDEQRAVGRGGDLAGVRHGRDGGDQADLEPVGDLRQGGGRPAPARAEQGGKRRRLCK